MRADLVLLPWELEDYLFPLLPRASESFRELPRATSYTYSLSGKGVIQQIRVLAPDQGRQIPARSEAGFIAIALTAYAGDYDQN